MRILVLFGLFWMFGSSVLGSGGQANRLSRLQSALKTAQTKQAAAKTDAEKANYQVQIDSLQLQIDKMTPIPSPDLKANSDAAAKASTANPNDVRLRVEADRAKLKADQATQRDVVTKELKGRKRFNPKSRTGKAAVKR